MSINIGELMKIKIKMSIYLFANMKNAKQAIDLPIYLGQDSIYKCMQRHGNTKLGIVHVLDFPQKYVRERGGACFERKKSAKSSINYCHYRMPKIITTYND